jgi:hypothetical protein
MPFIPNTPESLSTLLSRVDSNTCSGVTNAGKPCTRTLKTTPGSTTPTAGIVATIANTRVYFCEAHKVQSQNVALRHTASFARRRERIGRGSMDTFIEQVEVLVGAPGGGATTKTRITAKTKKVKGKDDPFAQQQQQAPAPQVRPPSPPGSHARPPRKEKRKQSLLRRLLCFCFGNDDGDDDDVEYGLSAGKKQTEAELRAAAAGVVEGGGNGNVRPARTQAAKDSKVLFETTPPTPPLPKMYPDRKQVSSAMAKNGKAATAATGGPPGRTPASDFDYTPVFDPNSTVNREFLTALFLPLSLPEMIDMLGMI